MDDEPPLFLNDQEFEPSESKARVPSNASEEPPSFDESDYLNDEDFGPSPHTVKKSSHAEVERQSADHPERDIFLGEQMIEVGENIESDQDLIDFIKAHPLVWNRFRSWLISGGNALLQMAEERIRIHQEQQSKRTKKAETGTVANTLRLMEQYEKDPAYTTKSNRVVAIAKESGISERMIWSHLRDPLLIGLAYRQEMESLIGIPEEEWDTIPERGFHFREALEKVLEKPMAEWCSLNEGCIQNAYEEIAAERGVDINTVISEVEQTRNYSMSQNQALEAVAGKHGRTSGEIFTAVQESRNHLEKRPGYFPVTQAFTVDDPVEGPRIVTVKSTGKLEKRPPDD